MGCFQSSASTSKDSPVARSKSDIKKGGNTASKTAVKEEVLYVAADPDLGWRHICGLSPAGPNALIRTESGSLMRGEYPEPGFWNVGFRNDRNGNVLNRIDVVSLALNIAGRAGKLASRFGLQEIDMNEFLKGADDAADVFGHRDLDMSVAAGIDAWNIEMKRSTSKVLRAFGCPDFGWSISQRKFPVNKLETQYTIKNLEEWRQRQDAGFPLLNVQKMMDKNGQTVLVDVPEVAVNIAEQLFRLEKSDSNVSQRIPSDVFGWRVGHSLTSDPSALTADGQIDTRKALMSSKRNSVDDIMVPVASPSGEALFVVPELLMMNVASWIQQTYLTSPVF